LEDEVQGFERDLDKSKIYKAGYKQGARIPRTFILKHKRFIKYFRCFCFKACAAEEIPRVKGLAERFVFIGMVEGFPRKDWADVNEEDYTRLRQLRDMLLKWRLASGDWQLPDVELPCKGRLAELWKPIIQIVHGLTVEKQLRAFVERLQQERLNEKMNTLEGRLVKVVAETYQNEPLPFTVVWEKLAEELEAKQDEKKPNMIDSAEFGVITKKQVGYRLREVLGGKKRSYRTADGFTKAYEFDSNKLHRIAKKYGVVSKCLMRPNSESAPMSKPENQTCEKSFFSENKPNLPSGKTAFNVETPQPIRHIGHLDTNFQNAEEAEKLDRAVPGTVPLESFKAVYWSDGYYDWHTCAVCGYTKLTSWQAETFKGEAVWLCEDCKEAWEKQQQAGDA